MGVWLGLAYVVSWALDWNFELPVAVRLALLVIAAAGLLFVAYHFILRRTFVRLSDSSMATLIERRYPALSDSLLTIVWLSSRSPEEAGYSPAMFEATRRTALERFGIVNLDDIFDPLPLVRKATIAIGLIAVIVGAYFLSPGMSSLWARRNLLLATDHWPRRIRFEADGFHNKVVKIASGSDFKLHVLALRGDTEVPIVPQNVEVRYRGEGGNRGRHVMDRIGALAASPGSTENVKDVLQVYEYKFSGLLASVQFDVVGGDGYLDNYQIQVVPNPSLNQVELEYAYPTYMERGPRREPVAGAMPVPIGAKIVIHAKSNKPLEQVRIDCPGNDARSTWRKDLTADALGNDRSTMAFEFVPFPAPAKGANDKAGKDVSKETLASRDMTLLFTLHDSDGISNREPIPLALVAVPDEPPQVALRMAGIGTAITPNARIPVTGKISDDYGLARAWFEYVAEGLPVDPKKATSQSDKAANKSALDASPSGKPAKDAEKDNVAAGNLTRNKKAGTEPLADLPKHPPEWTVTDSGFEVSKLNLLPQQKLRLNVKAADLYDLGPGGPNIGASEVWQLDVVTPDELRSLLQGRELVLRQRFESIVQEMRETRDLLIHVEFALPGESGDKSKTAKDKGGAAAGTKTPAGASKPVHEAGLEPGEVDIVRQKLTPAELLGQRTEQVLLGLQNCHKKTDETGGVVEGIDDIRLQMVNNRIETEQLKKRLGENVSEPLHLIYDQLYPQFAKDLESLQAALADPAAGPQRREIARQQADRLLLKMQEVLHNMLELENFNEVVQRLKAIIELQQKINKQTEDAHKKNIHDLLD